MHAYYQPHNHADFEVPTFSPKTRLCVCIRTRSDVHGSQRIGLCVVPNQLLECLMC